MHEKTQKKSKTNWFGPILLIGAIALTSITVWFLMKGSTKTIGKYHDDATSESLECIGESIPYNIFASDSTNAEIKITGIFTNEKLNSIYLVHKSKYDNMETAKNMQNVHEGDMNNSFYKNNMKSYSLNATYSTENNTTQMSLYAKTNDLDDTSARYFMLDGLPSSLTEYEKHYTSKGLNCKITK